MRTNNTRDKLSFITDHVMAVIWGYAFYSFFIFVRLPNRTRAESQLILAGIVILSSAVGMWFSMERHRNLPTVFWNTILGFGLYALLSLIPFRQKAVIVLMSVTVLLILAFAGLVFFRKVRNKNRFHMVMRRRMAAFVQGGRKILCTGFLALIVIALVNSMTKSTIVEVSNSSQIKSMGIDEYLEAHRDVEVLLRDEWDYIPIGSKLYVLGIVLEMEKGLLGIPGELSLGVKEMQDSSKGYYNDGDRLIVLSYDVLEGESKDCLKALFHELYHCYQFRLVDVFNSAGDEMMGLRFFESARKYKAEFEDYTSASEDPVAYYTQKCEEDARAFAAETVDRYVEWIETYLLEGGNAS